MNLREGSKQNGLEMAGEVLGEKELLLRGTKRHK